MNAHFIMDSKNKVNAFNSALVDACLKRGAHVGTAFFMDDYRIMKVTINPHLVHTRPYIYVAGIHGNEVGGPLGALQFIQRSTVPPDKRAIILPLVNPYGFEHEQRECKTGEDINRLFNDDPDHEVVRNLTNVISYQDPYFIHSIHEDPDRDEFYLYYSDDNREDLYRMFVETVAKEWLDVVEDDEEGGHPVKEGLCRPPMPKDPGYNKAEDRTFENHMLEQFGVHHLLTETPVEAKLEKRVLLTQKAMEFVLCTH